MPVRDTKRLSHLPSSCGNCLRTGPTPSSLASSDDVVVTTLAYLAGSAAYAAVPLVLVLAVARPDRRNDRRHHVAFGRRA